MRPFYCTKTGLTPAITPNVGNSSVEFLLVGTCVRARTFSNNLNSLFRIVIAVTRMCQGKQQQTDRYICYYGYILLYESDTTQ